MPNILFATMPITGHVNPGLPIAKELVSRGHSVHWYTGKKFQPTVEKLGCKFQSASVFESWDDANLEATFPDRNNYSGVDQLKYDLKRIFIDPIPDATRELLDISKKHGIDVIVVDTAFGAGPMTWELGGPPCVAFGITALALSSRDTAPFGLGILPSTMPGASVRNQLLNFMCDKVTFKDVVEHRNKVRRAMNLPPADCGLFDGIIKGSKLYLQGTVPEFEYPRTDMPDSVRFIGPLLPSSTTDKPKPDWWQEMLDCGKPVVHVSQGTIATDPEELIIPTLWALADLDVLVVASSRQLDPRRFKLPANARVADFLPYNELMQHLAVFVTNGGYGGVHYALASGVPIVVAGATEDKPEVANRVEWSGVGINLRTNRPASNDIRRAVRRVLRNQKYKRAAVSMQQRMLEHNAVKEAADLIAEVGSKTAVPV